MVAHRLVGGRGRARVAGGVGVSGGRGRPVFLERGWGVRWGGARGADQFALEAVVAVGCAAVRAVGGVPSGPRCLPRPARRFAPSPRSAGVVPSAGASLPTTGRRSRRADRYIDEPLTSGLLSPCLAPGQAPGGSA